LRVFLDQAAQGKAVIDQIPDRLGPAHILAGTGFIDCYEQLLRKPQADCLEVCVFFVIARRILI